MVCCELQELGRQTARNMWKLVSGGRLGFVPGRFLASLLSSACMGKFCNCSNQTKNCEKVSSLLPSCTLDTRFESQLFSRQFYHLTSKVFTLRCRYRFTDPRCCMLLGRRRIKLTKSMRVF